jgi:phosphohistidine phosphatase SixA
MTRRAAVVVVVAALLAGCGGDDDEAAKAPPSREARLVSALREGGLVIAFRHALTDQSYDREAGDYADCSKQRNLSRDGRRQAREVGQALRELRIPVGEVLSSPYCRTRDTAQLAFGRVRISRTLLPARGEDDPKLARFERLLGRAPKPGTDIVLVGHNDTMLAAANLELPEAGAAIFRPAGGGRYQLVGTVEPARWPVLVRELGDT